MQINWIRTKPEASWIELGDFNRNCTNMTECKIVFQSKLDSLAYVAKANKLYSAFIHRHRYTSVNCKSTVPGKTRGASKLRYNWPVMQKYIGALCISISYQQSSSVNIFFSKWDFNQAGMEKKKKKPQGKTLCYKNKQFFLACIRFDFSFCFLFWVYGWANLNKLVEVNVLIRFIKCLKNKLQFCFEWSLYKIMYKVS